MSQDIDWAPPCELCQAPAGEPCKDDCPSRGEGDRELPYLQEIAQSMLMASLYRLPFAAFITDPPDYHDIDSDHWLGQVALWMADYLAVAQAHISTLQADSRRAISLQIEKDIVSNFFKGMAA